MQGEEGGAWREKRPSDADSMLAKDVSLVKCLKRGKKKKKDCVGRGAGIYNLHPHVLGGSVISNC